MSRALGCAAVLALALWPSAAVAQTSDNVLLVINDASPASVQVGEYYARKRSVPQDHVVHLKLTTDEAIRRSDYESAIEGPIGQWIIEHSLHDKILYIVLTKGVPLRVAGTDGRDGTTASVDSELTLLYRKMVVTTPLPIAGRVANPYFAADKPIAELKPFTRLTYDIYLVTRLDGFTADDVLKLIDRASAPVTDGKIVLDQRVATLDTGGGDQWLAQARDRLKAGGAEARVVFEASRGAASATGPVLGYFSWGSNDPALRLRKVGLTFANGAIGGTFVSTDGRTFTEPPADWVPGPTDKPLGLFGNGSQSLAGDLIREGMTGVSAHVFEPYLDATIHPQILFPAYLAGFNLVESFYLAMPYLSWQTIVIGDPLCAPFARAPLDPSALYKGIDPETELPALFAERRLAATAALGLKPEALKLVMKADVLDRRGDNANVEALLEQATALEPKLAKAQLRLATAYDVRGEVDKAVTRYRRVLEFDPRNVIALNNLAYNIAVHQNNPKDALVIAQEAYALAPIPSVMDTLGWIHHLLGNDLAAVPFVERATTGNIKDADSFFHAAAVHEALNDRARARTELNTALKLDPKLADRPEVKALRDKLR